jgi:FSR family fosmidomycin resistance protein-like MFS transporter
MADIFGKRKVIFLMLALSPFFLFSAIKLDGIASLVLFVIGGACIAATSPVTLALAQEYMPESRSTASSIVMGVSWGIANMVASPIGMIADKIGLQRALGLLSLCPFLVVGAMAMGDISKRLKRKKKRG